MTAIVRILLASTVTVVALLPAPAPSAAASFTLAVVSSGTGAVDVAPLGAICRASCTFAVPADTSVSLQATPGDGFGFVGWGGACTGTGSCIVVMSRARTVTATFARFRLTVTRAGSGTVSGPGIDCGIDCGQGYPAGTSVSLDAAPADGFGFVGWGGACTGTGSCTVTMSKARTVMATFARYRLTVARTGSGVVSGPGIDCGTDCGEGYPAGTGVSLDAAPADGFGFVGWGGACTGTGPCTVTMSRARTVTAAFARYRLSVAHAGRGTVSGSGIDCGADCSEVYPAGTSISLAATPAPHWEFQGWTGACTGASTCDLTLSGPRSVTAHFAQLRDVPDVTAVDAIAFKDAGLTIVVSGAGFVHDSRIVVNNVAKPTTVLSDIHLRATLSAAESNGIPSISVTTPPPGGGQSVAVPFVADVGPFDGSYAGSYSGVDDESAPASGKVAFTVSNGTITVTVPGSGSGQIVNGGFAAGGGLTTGGEQCRFRGTFGLIELGGVNANGTWSCAFGEHGTWRAFRRTPVGPQDPRPLTDDDDLDIQGIYAGTSSLDPATLGGINVPITGIPMRVAIFNQQPNIVLENGQSVVRGSHFEACLSDGTPLRGALSACRHRTTGNVCDQRTIGMGSTGGGDDVTTLSGTVSGAHGGHMTGQWTQQDAVTAGTGRSRGSFDLTGPSAAVGACPFP